VCHALLMLGALLGGCDRPVQHGNQWKEQPKAVVSPPSTPSVGACYNVPVDFSLHMDVDIRGYGSGVGCDAQHTAETVYVGSFAGANAQATAPPVFGDRSLRDAYAECTRAANDFLGADWRTGWIDLAMTTPPAASWHAGTRWFRCDLLETEDASVALPRTGSLRGALAGAAPLAYRCALASKRSGKSTVARTDCAASHNLEFAGLYDAPDRPFPDSDDDNDAVGRPGCLPKIAEYAKVPASDVNYRTGWWFMNYSRGGWTLGNRGMRCFLYGEDTWTGSVAGAGPSRLPIR
jgi:hypothetical protein